MTVAPEVSRSLGGQVLAVLARHLTMLNAHNVLAHAQRDSRVGTLATVDDVRVIRPALERGLRPFLGPTAVAQVMAELARLFSSGPPVPRIIAIQAERDVSDARMVAWVMCEQLGARRVVTQKVATAVSELARNIFMYTPGGTIELRPEAGERNAKITVRAVDRGKGIPNLDEIMAGRYRSRTGLGAGLLGTKRLVERFHIETGLNGTQIEIGIDL
jgi:serine/threonine-protein kinase RsbT